MDPVTDTSESKDEKKKARTPLPKVETDKAYDPWKKLDRSPDELVNVEPGFDYRYQPMRDFPADGIAADDWRNKLAARGFEPCNGPRLQGPRHVVYHPSQPTAEIWRRPIAGAEEEWRVRLAELVTKPAFCVHFKNHPSASPVLPEALRIAMLAFHDKALPREQKPTVAELRELVREVPVHPGEAKKRRWQR